FDPPVPFKGGIEGAAIASVLSNIIGIGIFACFMFTRENERIYQLRSAWRISFQLLKRLLRYGLPAGLQQFVDIVSFATFLLVVGKFGIQAQFASNAAMNVNI